MKILRVNMKEASLKWEPVPKEYEQVGGRALIAKLLLKEIPPACDALGPHNKLIFTPGLLGGAMVATAGRLSVGAKSPLTRGIKEANAGGTSGDALGKLGIKAISDDFSIPDILGDRAIYRCHGTCRIPQLVPKLLSTLYQFRI